MGLTYSRGRARWLGPCGNAPFPVPAHQTGRADFPHPAFRLVSPRGTRRRAECGACCRSSGRWQTRPAAPIGVRLRRGVKLLQKRPDTQGCSRLIANHRSSAPSKAHQKQGPFPPPALPGLNGRMALSDSRPTRRLCDGGAASPSRDGSPPMTRTTLPPCRAPYPGGSRRVPVSIASPLTRPSPFPRRVVIRIFTFEACSGFTRVTARWVSQPPKAAFVTRLQPSQLPDQTARQLPEQSTTLRVEPSSTGDTRRRGALGNPGLDLSHEALGTPERQQRHRDPPVGIGGGVLKVDRGRRAVVLADGVPRRGIEIAAQILLEQRFAGRAWRLALALDVRAQEELRIRRDQPLRQGLDQEEPPKIARRELLVGPRVHGCG